MVHSKHEIFLHKNSVYLNFTEENFVPDAVAANDPTADFSTFSLCSKVEQPTLQGGVSLAEDLQERQVHTPATYTLNALKPSAWWCQIILQFS